MTRFFFLFLRVHISLFFLCLPLLEVRLSFGSSFELASFSSSSFYSLEGEEEEGRERKESMEKRPETKLGGREENEGECSQSVTVVKHTGTA